jgi:hypothetical protein
MMKRLFTILFFFILVSPSVTKAQATCPTSTVSLSTQADVTAFVATYGTCSTLPYDLAIFGTVNDLTPLAGTALTTITGDLRIGSSALTSLNGLSNLTTVYGGVFIETNASLLNTNGLSALATVGRQVSILRNNALTSLALPVLTALNSTSYQEALLIRENPQLISMNFAALTTVARDIEIRNNSTLPNLTGFGALQTVFGRLRIWQNSGMTSTTGMPALTTVGNSPVAFEDELWIYQNDALTTITGFNALTSVVGTFTIESNPILTSVNFPVLTTASLFVLNSNPQLSSVAGFSTLDNVITFTIFNCDALTTLTGFELVGPNLEAVNITGNLILQNLNGLTGIQNVTSTFYLNSNSALVNVNGLTNLVGVGTLTLEGNGILTNISGLQNIVLNANSSLTIRNNTGLAICNLPNICSWLAAGNNFATILDNAVGCATQAQVVVACQPNNDECANAFSISTCSATTSGTTVGKTLSTNRPTTTGVFAINSTNLPDMWFKFTATSTIHRLNVNVTRDASSSATTAHHIAVIGDCSQSNASFRAYMIRNTPSVSNFDVYGLTIGSVYYVYVAGTAINATICTEGKEEVFAPATPTTPAILTPPNDACANAIAMPTADVGAGCGSIINGTTVGATESSPPFTSYTSKSPDVWYKFTATSIRHVLRLTNVQHKSGAGLFNYAVYITTSCSAPTGFGNQTTGWSVNSAVGSFYTASSFLTIGQEYYVRVVGTGVTFDLCLEAVDWSPAPANASAATSVILTPSNSCGSVTGLGVPFGGGIWYKFVATKTTHKVDCNNIFSQATAGVLYRPEGRFHSDNSGTPVLIGTFVANYVSSNNATTNFSGLTIGQTYYIEVRPTTTSGMLYLTHQLCLDLTLPPFADNCSDALLLPVSSTMTATWTASTLAAATSSGLSQVLCSPSAPNYRDIWFKFTTTSARTLISLRGTGVTSFAFGIYTGDCNSLTYQTCGIGNESESFLLRNSNIPTGTVVYLRVYELFGSIYNGSFEVAIRTPPSAPANDDCLGAITLSKSSSSPTVGATDYATNDLSWSPNAPSAPCGSLNGTIYYHSDASVWYKFVAQNQSSILKLAEVINYNATTMAYNSNPVDVEVYSGACGAWTCVTAGTRTGLGALSNTSVFELPLSNLTIGNTYFVRVQTWRNTLSTSFKLHLQEIPVQVWAGIPNICLPLVSPLIPNIWNTISDANGIVAQIHPNGQFLFLTNAGIYTHQASTVRTTNLGSPYLNRNYAFNLATQPISPVSMRLYFTQADYAALQAADPSLIDGSSLRVTRVSGGVTTCSNSFSLGVGQTINVINGTLKSFGNDHYIEFNTQSFSNFFINTVTSALPIELLSFRATNTEGGNQLKWQTASEINTAHFDIERSNDGKQFEKIGETKAQGKVAMYEYLDKTPFGGWGVYYRLKINDLDGKSSYSNVVALSPKVEGFTAKVYPNPANDMVTVSIEVEKKSDITLELKDILGRTIWQSKAENTEGSLSLPIPMTEWANGTYFLKISNRQTAKQERIVKN